MYKYLYIEYGRVGETRASVTAGNPISEKDQQQPRQQQMRKKSDIENVGCKRINGQVEPNQVLSSIEETGSSSKRQTEIVNPDPLLDLVIASESPSSQQATLLKMAAEAARISYEAVTTPKTSTIAADMTLHDSHILEKLTGLGAVIPDSMLPALNPLITPPKKDKKYFLELSDSELCASEFTLFIFSFYLIMNYKSFSLSVSPKVVRLFLAKDWSNYRGNDNQLTCEISLIISILRAFRSYNENLQRKWMDYWKVAE